MKFLRECSRDYYSNESFLSQPFSFCSSCSSVFQVYSLRLMALQRKRGALDQVSSTSFDILYRDVLSILVVDDFQ